MRTVRDFDLALGVDLSATNTTVLLGNSDGHVYSLRRSKTDKGAPESPIRNAIRLSHQCLDEEGLSYDDIKGVGVSCLGPYDDETGSIVGTPNIDFDVVPVRDPIKEEFGDIPFVRGGDCFGAVHAEYDFGEFEGVDDLGYITISTGIGGGFIVDGKAKKGKNGDAGHVGHFTVNPLPTARRCGCVDENGNQRKGHWEAYCSGTAVAEQVQELFWTGKEYYDSILEGRVKIENTDLSMIMDATKRRLGKRPSVEDIRAEDLYQAVNDGVLGAPRQLVRDINYYNTIGVANATDSDDLEVIVFGGSMMNDSDLILPYVREHLTEHAILKPPKLAVTNLGSKNVALGGLAMLKHYKGE